jgi:hypothetical protein
MYDKTNLGTMNGGLVGEIQRCRGGDRLVSKQTGCCTDNLDLLGSLPVYKYKTQDGEGLMDAWTAFTILALVISVVGIYLARQVEEEEKKK